MDIASIQNVRGMSIHVHKNNHAPKQNSTNFISNKNLWTSNATNAVKMNNFNYARTISFGASLGVAIKDNTKDMITCGNEKVGEAVDVTSLLFNTQSDRVIPGDTAKSNTMIGSRFVRNQAKAIGANTFEKTQDNLFEMTVRGDDAKSYSDRSKKIIQDVKVVITPVNKKGQGTREQIHVINTKGNKGDNFVAVINDGKNVLMTNAGTIQKKDQSQGKLIVSAEQEKNIFKPFEVSPITAVKNTPMPSIGEGTEIVIGMENGRFVNEIKASIKEFVKKIESGEIVLPQFVAAPNAKDTQLIMLAGGFGSRAEYANAISDSIINGTQDGAISTKGVFRTATGLTPMETTFVTLHKAGLLDCSKGKIGIGKNIKFYLNKGQNRGNGEFSADLYKTMTKEGRKSAILFPNDSMSRMTNAVIEANNIMNTGKAAIVLIAKKVKAQDCIKTFGIMKYDPETKVIQGFAEKPEVIPEGYADEDGMCVTNTFQFAVSDKAFKVLDMLEPYFVTRAGKKETRDWSKQYIPIIKLLTEENDEKVIRDELAKILDNDPKNISEGLVTYLKSLLEGQKIYAVPTDEAWADCGTLNALYDTTMKIVSGAFKLEDFEQEHAQECVNTQTGLIASTPEQKKEIEEKYDIDGQVMVAHPAIKITDDDVKDVAVTINYV